MMNFRQVLKAYLGADVYRRFPQLTDRYYKLVTSMARRGYRYDFTKNSLLNHTLYAKHLSSTGKIDLAILEQKFIKKCAANKLSLLRERNKAKLNL